MNEAFHPMTVGEVLDRTAQYYRQRFLLYFGISFIPSGVMLAFLTLIAATAFALRHSNPANDATTGLVTGLVMMVTFFAGVPAYLGSLALGWAALCEAASRNFLGQAVTIREAYKAVWKRGWGYVGLCFLLVLFVFAIPGIAMGIGAGLITGLSIGFRSAAGADAASTLAGIAFFMLFVGLAVAIVWLMLRLCLAFPSSVVERASAWTALKRSSSLSAGSRWRILVLFLLGVSLGWVVALGIFVPVVFIIALIPALRGPQHAEALGTITVLVFYGLSFLSQALIRPVYGIGLTLFYFDLRIRKEGFDIEWMMSRAGLVPAELPLQQGTAWTAINPDALTGVVPVSHSSADPAPDAPSAPVSEPQQPAPGEAL